MRQLGIVLLLLGGMFAAGPVSAEPSPRGATAVKIKVSGMVCAFCAQGLLKAFKARHGVLNVDASLETRQLTVYVRKDDPLSQEDARKLVEDAGYEVESFETDASPR